MAEWEPKDYMAEWEPKGTCRTSGGSSAPPHPPQQSGRHFRTSRAPGKSQRLRRTTGLTKSARGPPERFYMTISLVLLRSASLEFHQSSLRKALQGATMEWVRQGALRSSLELLGRAPKDSLGALRELLGALGGS